MTSHRKVALVTGAARGIGLAIAQHLARQDVQVIGVDQSPAASSEGIEIATLDVTDEAAVNAFAQDVIARHGGIDILVNNAGISPKKDGRKFYLEEIELAQWNQVLAVNLSSIFMLSKAVVPSMKARGGGRIVNISSQAGRGRSDLTSSHYATSKAGVIGLTRSMAGELGKYGICVTAVAPGFITTDMSGAYSAQRIQAVVDSIPVRRAGTVEDIASAVAFLASDAAGFINGAVLDVNGGGYM